MSLFTKIRDAGRIKDVEELFSSPSAASAAGEELAQDQKVQISGLGRDIAASRSKALEVGAGSASQRREAAAGFANTVGSSTTKTGTVIEAVGSPSQKVSGREASRLDFAAVTAPHLLLERGNKTAKGQGVVSKKR